ncbi:MAG: alpha/beta hydrolase-fold protein [Ignavibacteriaceae bacterium]|nr:alpha/beta hydrolase-fold protein [Ignavibacteriaceae bacterium]
MLKHKKKLPGWTYTILLIVLVIYPKLYFGQVQNNNINIGRSVEFTSQILNEKRDILIYTPDGYEESDIKYPTLYITDGAENFLIATAIVNFLSRNQQIPRMIVIGIPNVNRNRDLSPSVIQGTSNPGGGDKFLNFFEDELIPYLDKTYRTNNYRVLFGHSLGGMFANYTMLTKPELFNAFIAASPYLMYNDEYIINEAESKLYNLSGFERQLFITLGNESAYHKSLNKFTSLLTEKAKSLRWDYQIFNDEDHNSIPMITLLKGLIYIYSDFQLTMETAMQGMEAVLDHYSLLNAKYDYSLDIPEATLNIIGYRLMQNEQIDKAIEVFEYNVKLYPNSANVYDSLAEAFEQAGMTKEAVINYKIAVKIGKEINDPNLTIFERNLARVEIVVK